MEPQIRSNPIARAIRRLGADPVRVQDDLLHRTNNPLWYRRATIASSLAGFAVMTPVALFQTGLIKHLPDPPSRFFHSDKVNSSDQAYQFGAPDGALVLVSLALNVLIAAFGGEDRARATPWLPLLAAAKAAADATTGAAYMYEMIFKEKSPAPIASVARSTASSRLA